MKIIFFISSLESGGAERVTLNLANYWAEKGWSVLIVTVAGSEKDFYRLDPRVERISLMLDGESNRIWQAFANNLRRIIALRRILKLRKPDVAIAMMASANSILSLAGLMLPVLTIGSERTYPPAMPLGRAWEMARRLSYPHLSALVAQTQQSAEWLKSNAPAQRIQVISNPVHFPLAAHEPKVSPKVVQQKIGFSNLLLAVGRLGEEKCFDRLLNAFAQLSDKYPEWGLVILGKGMQRSLLEEQAVSLGISQRVSFPGAVGNVGEWYEAADIYTLTSRFEGFPNTLLEALSYGVPGIAVDCETGPSEILRHEIDGLLVPQNDQFALISALDKLMADPALRAKYSARALEVRERFALGTIAGMWERLFESILSEQSRT